MRPWQMIAGVPMQPLLEDSRTFRTHTDPRKKAAVQAVRLSAEVHARHKLTCLRPRAGGASAVKQGGLRPIDALQDQELALAIVQV